MSQDGIQEYRSTRIDTPKSMPYTRGKGDLVLSLGPAEPGNVRDRLNAYAFRDAETLEWVYLRLNPKTGQLIHPTKGYDVCGALTKTPARPNDGLEHRIWSAAGPVCLSHAGEGSELGPYGRCSEHRGIGYQYQLAALERLGIRQAKAVLAGLGNPVDVNPVEALLYLVQEAAGNVAFLGARVQDMGYDLVGDVYSLARDGTPVATSEDIRAIVKLYNDERDRLARVSKIALDAGIEERTVRVLEEQATVLVQVIRSVIDNLGMPPDVRQRALALVTAELRRLDTVAEFDGETADSNGSSEPIEPLDSNGVAR